MTTLSKIMKSKTIKEAILNIPDSFFNAVGFLSAMVFTILP